MNIYCREKSRTDMSSKGTKSEEEFSFPFFLNVELPFFYGSLHQLRQALGLESVNAVEVVHCRWAYGLSLMHESGWKLM